MRLPIFKNTMRRYIILYTSLLITATISCLTVFTLYIFSKTMTEQAVGNIKVVSALSTENIDIYLRGVENSILTFISDDRLSSDLTRYDPANIPQRYAAKSDIDTLIRSILRSNRYIQDIIVISDDIQTNCIDSSYNAVVKYDGSVISDIVSQCSSSETLFLEYRTVTGNDIYYTPDTSQELLIYFPLLNYKNAKNENIATVIFRYDIDALTSLQSEPHPWAEYSAYIMDENYHDITGGNPYEAVFRALGNDTKITQLDGRDCILTVSTIATNDWKLGYIIDLSAVTDSLRLLRNSALLLLVFSILIAVLLSVYIGFQCTSPILRLTDRMQRVARGDFETKMDTAQAFEEMQILSRGFNTMIERIDYLIKQVYLKELAQNRAEMKALEAKINPHFLYNCLQTINSMAILHDSPPIQHFVTQLASSFEYVLYNHNTPVPLSAEIDHIKTFLSIHEVRFGAKIRFHVETSEAELLQTPIFKLMLQPLVENSLKHGFYECERPPAVMLSIRKAPSGLKIVLTDNGVGISPAKLSEIHLALSQSDDDSHFGLSSICRRIHLCYGSDATLDIRSKEGYWTQIMLCIPLERQDLL